MEGRDLLHGTFFGGDLGHFVFESTDLEMGTGATVGMQESLCFSSPHVGKISVGSDNGGGHAPWSGPSTGWEVQANQTDRITREIFATEWTGRREAGGCLFDYGTAATRAQDMSWIPLDFFFMKEHIKKATYRKEWNEVGSAGQTPPRTHRRLNQIEELALDQPVKSTPRVVEEK